MLAVAGGDKISESDSGTDAYAQYVIYKSGKPVKVLLINTDYYSGTGTRSQKTFTMTGLTCGSVSAIRLTASSSELSTGLVQSDPSLFPSVGGKQSIISRSLTLKANGISSFQVNTFRTAIALSLAGVFLKQHRCQNLAKYSLR